MDINGILERASKLRIAVIGDLITDHYIYGSVDRISPEAPVPVLRRQSSKVTMGGAGNVFLNLLNLGVNTELFCNFDGLKFWSDEIDHRIHCNIYPHAKKTRVMCGTHQMLRIDDEIDVIEWLNFKQMIWWKYLLDNSDKYDAFVISDYGKGVVSDSVINTIIDYQNINKTEGKFSPVIVDAKRNFLRFRNAYCVKANDKEINNDIISSCVDRNNYVVKTCGARGISWFTSTYSDGVDGIRVPIVDVSGAGDTVAGVLAMMIPQVTDFSQAVMLANIAASEVCRHPGVYPITKEDLIQAYGNNR